MRLLGDRPVPRGLYHGSAWWFIGGFTIGIHCPPTTLCAGYNCGMPPSTKYHGPVAERAAIQAARIAKAMHRRLRGVDASELDALLVAERVVPRTCIPVGGLVSRTL